MGAVVDTGAVGLVYYSSLSMRAHRDWISLCNSVTRPLNCSMIITIAVWRVGLEDSINADIGVNVRVK